MDTLTGVDERPSGPTPSADRPPYLALCGLEKRYGSTVVVSRIDLEGRAGEFIALLGPSGCGKTTTLRIVAGLVPATAGRVLIGGRDITHLRPYERDVGLVFQSYALFPHLTVDENVAFGLEMRKTPKADVGRRVTEALRMVRLDRYARRYPRELSGGQQQRVALARALVMRPSILLLDEPLSNLDAKLRDEMRTEIRDIQRRLGITTLFVTHDQVEALSMCDRIAVMCDGRLVQFATPNEIYERPVAPFVADFVGRTNKLYGTTRSSGVVDIGGDRLVVTASDLPANVPVIVMMRPHRIALLPAHESQSAANANVLQGTVRRMTYVGDVQQYDVEIGPHMLQVERHTTSGLQPFSLGQLVHVIWNREDTLVFEGHA